MQHLESCDSCHRFQHQLDQVIQSTAEVPLPDECLPSNLEALAKRIMVEIPQEKPGFMSMLKGMFPFLNGAQPQQIKSKKDKPVKAGKGSNVADETDDQKVSSNFPHVRRPKGSAADDQSGMPTPKGKRGVQPVDEDLLATSTRLKSLQRLQPVDQDPQAMSSASLGTKFGMNVPMRDGGNGGNEPMTLAESIRRKVSDDAEQKTRDSDWAQLTSGSHNFNFGEQQTESGEQPAPFGPGSSGFGSGSPFAPPTPNAFSGQGAPPAPPFQQPGFGQTNSGQSFQQNPAQQSSGQWGDPGVAAAPQAGAGWGDPPTPGVGGDSDWKPGSSDWQIAKPQTPAWGGAPQTGGQPPAGAQAPADAGQPGWGSAWPEEADNGWDHGSQQQAAPWQQQDVQPVAQTSWQNQTTSGNQTWGAQPAAPAADDGWGAPPKPAADEWAVPKPAAAPANDGWGAPTPAPAATNNNDGWGAPQAAAPVADNWGAPKPAAPAANDGWGAPAPAANDGWGAPPAPASAPLASNDGWGVQSSAQGGWGTTGGAAPAAPANEGWGVPAPAAASAPANSGWGSPNAQSQVNDGWNTGGTPPAPAQPAANAGWDAGSPAPNTSTGGWGAPTQAGWGQQQQSVQAQSQTNPHLTAAPPPDSPMQQQQQAGGMPQAGSFDAWSEEGEQIQTGMWQAFTLDEPALGAPKSNNAGRPSMSIPKPGQAPTPDPAAANRWEQPIQQRDASPAAPAQQTDSADRWDVPINERAKAQQFQPEAPMAPPPPPNAPMSAAPPLPSAAGQPASDNRWEQPIQQRSEPAAPPAPPVPPAPAAPPVPPQPGAAQPPAAKNGIMDRLNSILGEDLTAMAGGPGQPAGWNAQKPEPAAQGWSAPNAVPQQQAEQPKSDMSQYEIPIQERMKQAQAAAVPAPEPVAAGQAGGLFKNLDDRAIDSVFSQLGVTETARPVNNAAPPAPPAPPAQPTAVPPVPPMAAMNQAAASQAPPPPVAPMQPPSYPGAGTGAPVIRPVSPQGAGPKISAVPQRPVPPTAAPTPQAAQAPAESADSNGIFKQLDDRAMDQIFNTLGVKDGAQPVNAAPPQQMNAPAPMPPRPAAPAASPVAPAARTVPPPVPPVGQGAPAAQGGWTQPAAPAPAAAPVGPRPTASPAGVAPARRTGSGLFSVDDEAMDRIFQDLGVKEKPEDVPKINVREAVQQIRTIADAAPPTKVEGTGRLSREEPTAEPTPGKIAAIGKFLLDAQDLQKIGRLTEQDLSDTKIRVLTHEASDEINKLLEHIATQAGVIGSVIVGHDGILIANSLPKELDPESIGILSLAIYVNTTNISKKMGHNHLHQLVSRTHLGYVVVADFGGGILVTVSNGQETEKLIPLMRSITQLVAQT